MSAPAPSRTVSLALAVSALLHFAAGAAISAYTQRPLSGITGSGPIPLRALLRPPSLQEQNAPLQPPSVPPPATAVETHLPDNPPAVAPPPAAAPASVPYLPAGALTRRPRLLVGVDPVFPANGGRVEGSVVLKVMVNERGLVDDVEIESADLPEAYTQAARDAFLGAAYHPGERAGRPVRSWLRVEVSYTDRIDQVP